MSILLKAIVVIVYLILCPQVIYLLLLTRTLYIEIYAQTLINLKKASTEKEKFPRLKSATTSREPPLRTLNYGPQGLW